MGEGILKRRTLVISAVNLFEGGPLSLLKDCLEFINSSNLLSGYKVIALVHRKNLFSSVSLENIELREFPQARSSYLQRLKHEFFYFYRFSRDHQVDVWLSLHDISPRVRVEQQFVYCHNPTPFKQIAISDLFDQPTIFFFSLFYRFLYSINIHKNRYVIVQQNWIKEEFKRLFDLPPDRIIVSKPVVTCPEVNKPNEVTTIGNMFFFPTFPRPFKNLEVIGNATKVLIQQGTSDFEVLITVDGSENKYSRRIVDLFKGIPQIKFIGTIDRTEVYNHYRRSKCLLFPSKLETWGLPISEYKMFNKIILAADLPYARETVGDYAKVKFFNPDSPEALAKLMTDVIKNDEINFDVNQKVQYEQPFAEDWQQLFNLLLKE